MAEHSFGTCRARRVARLINNSHEQVRAHLTCGRKMMLVLSRKTQEKILINGGEVTITIVEVTGQRVKVGIEAPQHISIHRSEVVERSLELAEASI
jgi:carbon storage regulator